MIDVNVYGFEFPKVHIFLHLTKKNNDYLAFRVQNNRF